MEKEIQLQKITACAFLHKEGKLFVAKRADSKKFLPGKFELPGGHIEYKEDIESGLKREFLEEFDLKVKVGDPFYAFTYLDGSNYHTIEIIYFAELADSNSQINIKPEEHSEYRWINRENLDDIWSKEDAEYKAIQKGFDLLESKK